MMATHHVKTAPLAGWQSAAPAFSGAAGIVRQEIEKLTRAPFSIPAGKTLFEEGDEWSGVLQIQRGWMLSYKSFDDGETQILDFLIPGDIIIPASGDGISARFSLEAITDAQIITVPRKTWDRMLAQSEQFATSVSHIRSALHARTSERVLRLGKGTASVRVAYVLLEMCIRLKAVGIAANNCEFHLPMTQRHIGDYCGLSSVHVCRTLRRMNRHEIIETSDHIDVRILDVDALAEIAKVDREWLCLEITPA